MTQSTLTLIRRSYAEAVEKSTTISDVIPKLYDILKKKKVEPEDEELFKFFVDNLKFKP